MILLIGGLLEQAEELIRMGLKPVEIIEGYELARDKILNDFLPELAVAEVKDVRNSEYVQKAIRCSVMSKQYGNEDFLSTLITKACLAVTPEGSPFNVDNVRVIKIVGSAVQKSLVVQGMLFRRLVEGTITKAENAKVVVFTCPLDIASTETKGTVLIKTAAELMTFSQGEENMLEAQIKAIADAGVKVIVSGGKFGDMAIHYCNKYGLMAVRLQSKFDVRRLCKAVGATALPNIVPPKADELGSCDHVYVDEIGDTGLIVFKQESQNSKIATVVIRGATDNIMDDIERAVDDGVNTFKALSKDGRLVAGAGAFEVEVATKITTFGETLPGMEQYAVQKFAEALLSLPAAIADNAGINSKDLITSLLAAHIGGNKNAAIDITSDTPAILDAVKVDLLDLFVAKHWGIKYATSTACTILQVDQIIMAKRAGGPAPRQGGGDWDQD